MQIESAPDCITKTKRITIGLFLKVFLIFFILPSWSFSSQNCSSEVLSFSEAEELLQMANSKIASLNAQVEEKTGTITALQVTNARVAF